MGGENSTNSGLWHLLSYESSLLFISKQSIPHNQHCVSSQSWPRNEIICDGIEIYLPAISSWPWIQAMWFSRACTTFYLEGVLLRRRLENIPSDVDDETRTVKVSITSLATSNNTSRSWSPSSPERISTTSLNVFTGVLCCLAISMLKALRLKMSPVKLRHLGDVVIPSWELFNLCHVLPHL